MKRRKDRAFRAAIQAPYRGCNGSMRSRERFRLSVAPRQSHANRTVIAGHGTEPTMTQIEENERQLNAAPGDSPGSLLQAASGRLSNRHAEPELWPEELDKKATVSGARAALPSI